MKTTVRFFFLVGLMVFIPVLSSFSQVSINTTGNPPVSSAMLEITSTTGGLLIPRMTNTQVQAIYDPADGLIVYCTDDNKFYTFIGPENKWKEILFGSASLLPPLRCGIDLLNDTRDGKNYSTVQIGTQCWMAQNLNVGTMITGTSNQTNNSINEKYCYDNNETNCNIYGGLYQWAEMVQYINGATNTTSWNPVPTGNITGICPAGWHLPSDAEWSTLFTFLGGINIAGGKMKEAGTSHWMEPNTGATNSSGFSGLPSGINDGSFKKMFTDGPFYRTTEHLYSPGNTAMIYYLYYAKEDVTTTGYFKVIGLPVRCIKD